MINQSKSRNLLWVALFTVLGLILSTVSPVLAGPPATQHYQDFESFFDEALQEQLKSEHIAGAAVALVQNGELAFAKGYGYANVESDTPVRADRTLFFIGSDGKLFTWTAIMQLVEQGKLDLQADLTTYLDFEIPATFAQPITLHHLMTHTAGFEDEFNSLFVADSSQLLPLREHLIRYMPERVYPPGQVMAYSNYGTALAGYVIERVSGQTFESYISEHLLQPLGMTHSVVGNSVPPALAADLSTGYQYQNGEYRPADFEWTAATPCAPIRTTALDLSRFMLAHLNNGCIASNCILRSETVDLMHNLQFTHHPEMGGMAYGFMSMKINGQQVLWHLGQSPRFITLLALIPDQNLGLAVSYNTPPADDGRAILFRFMNTYFPVSYPALNDQPLSGWQERADLFNGIYVPARSNHSTSQILSRYSSAIPVTIDQGQLNFNGWDFVETEPGLFHQVQGDRVLTLEQGEDGQRWLFVGVLAYFRLPWYETPAFLLTVLGSCLLIFLSTWIAWPICAIHYRKEAGTPHQGVLWLAGGLGLFDIGLLAWFISVLLRLAQDYVFSGQTASIITGLYWLAIPVTLAVLIIAVRTWLNRQWTLGWRVHYSLAALAATTFLWLVWNFNLAFR
jgi:CubicO group peptidase (beta-lactamase class C family)